MNTCYDFHTCGLVSWACKTYRLWLIFSPKMLTDSRKKIQSQWLVCISPIYQATCVKVITCVHQDQMKAFIKIMIYFVCESLLKTELYTDYWKYWEICNGHQILHQVLYINITCGNPFNDFYVILYFKFNLTTTFQCREINRIWKWKKKCKLWNGHSGCPLNCEP